QAYRGGARREAPAGERDRQRIDSHRRITHTSWPRCLAPIAAGGVCDRTGHHMTRSKNSPNQNAPPSRSLRRYTATHPATDSATISTGTAKRQQVIQKTRAQRLWCKLKPTERSVAVQLAKANLLHPRRSVQP